METKAELPLDLLQGSAVPEIVRAYFEINHLKQLYRQGWLRRGVPRERCESVAEHTFAAALLAAWLAQAYYPRLDPCRTLLMALVHDLGEVYAGDITPADALEAGEKHQRERQAVRTIFSRLPGGDRYLELWEEYERGETPEARLVRQVDRLEMGLQAAVYARQGYPDMGEFYASARQALVDPQLVELLQSVAGAP